MRPLALLALPFVALACVTEVHAPIAAAMTPVAHLACPDAGAVGVPLSLDGSASLVPTGAVATITVLGETHDGVTLEITPVAPGPLLARLVVSDAAGAESVAMCRFLVEGDAPVEPEAPDEPGDPVTPDEPDTREPFDLTGTFAMIGYDRPELNGFPLDPLRQCAPAPALALVEFVQDGTDVTMTSKVCHITMPSVRIFAVDVQVSSVPAALVDAMPAMGPVSFTLSTNLEGALFAPPLADPLVVGATLADPSEALPTDANDARVVDADGNGEPGVTIESTSGTQNVVYRRTVQALNGVVRSSSFIDGATEGSFRIDGETSLLSFLDFLVPTGSGLPSTFAMKRIDGAYGSDDWSGVDGLLSCEDVRAQLDLLVAEFPPLANPDGCASYGN